ncbi:hypothetical protein JCM10213_002615 [Rhodosporidiobolus nylandii]
MQLTLLAALSFALAVVALPTPQEAEAPAAPSDPSDPSAATDPSAAIDPSASAPGFMDSFDPSSFGSFGEDDPAASDPSSADPSTGTVAPGDPSSADPSTGSVAAGNPSSADPSTAAVGASDPSSTDPFADDFDPDFDDDEAPAPATPATGAAAPATPDTGAAAPVTPDAADAVASPSTGAAQGNNQGSFSDFGGDNFDMSSFLDNTVLADVGNNEQAATEANSGPGINESTSPNEPVTGGEAAAPAS